MVGFSNYCLGVAEQQLGHRQRAADAFSVAAELGPVHDPFVSLESAEMMRELGHSSPAERIKEAVALSHGTNLSFWIQVQTWALESKSEGLMLESASRVYRLNPTDALARHNFAGALLLNRTNVAEALKLTAALLADAPNDLPRIINQAQALLLNRHYNEAEKLFLEISGQRVNSIIANEYYLTRGEVLIELDRRREAALLLAQVEESRLFPVQVRQLRLLRERAVVP